MADIVPENIHVNQNSSVLIYISTDDSLRMLAKNACSLDPRQFQNTMQGKGSLSKLLYYLYCQESKLYRLIKGRRELLKNINFKLSHEHTELQKLSAQPNLKNEQRLNYENHIKSIERLERTILALEKRLEQMDVKLDRIRKNRVTISSQFTNQAVNLRSQLAEELKKNGMSNTQEHELYKAIQILLHIVTKDLSPEERQAQWAEVPDDVKKLLESELNG